jgi:hypothetical protein
LIRRDSIDLESLKATQMIIKKHSWTKKIQDDIIFLNIEMTIYLIDPDKPQLTC